ncbi:MAG TPA: hypothetical protein VGF94_00025 [Kofleriaceae bacterium]|jgi:hypothetical protein
MRLTLPRGNLQKFCGVIAFLLASCSHPVAAPPPGTPLAAEPDLRLGSMDDECNALIAAIDGYGACPNADEGERAWAKALSEDAKEDFTAGKKGETDAPAQHEIAVKCHKAAVSMRAKTQRCQAGPTPKGDY